MAIKQSNLMSEFIKALVKRGSSTTNAPGAGQTYLAKTVTGDDFYKNGFISPKTGMQTAIQLSYPCVRAVEMMLSANGLLYADAVDYQVVAKTVTRKDANGKNIKVKHYMGEIRFRDGSDTSVVVLKEGDDIRISFMESDGTNNPVGEFKSFSHYALSLVCLICLPEILEADRNAGPNGGKMDKMMADFATFLPGMLQWQSEADVPELANKCALYLSYAMYGYFKEVANFSFAISDTAASPDPVPVDITDNGYSGAVVVCSNPNVNFEFAKSNGSQDTSGSKKFTVKEMRDKVASYLTPRNWTPQQRKRIPNLDPNMIVMPEVLDFAWAYILTQDLKLTRPMRNFCWRGITSYGKSTGVEQLAYILQRPLVRKTFYSGIEKEELFDSFVPNPRKGKLCAPVVQMEEDLLNEDVKEAVSYVNGLDEESRKDFLSGTDFYMMAGLDPAGAGMSLFGKSIYMEPEDLCRVYTDVVCYFRTYDLRAQMAQMTKDGYAVPQKEEPDFIHVLSPVAEACMFGMIIEFQEIGRARDPGVLVSLNELDRPGAIMRLADGTEIVRHADTIFFFTDNIGYASSRPIDQSCIRRMDLVVDSHVLPEDMLKERILVNTGCKDDRLLTRCLTAYHDVETYCREAAITSGSVSASEAENLVKWMMATQAMGMDEEEAFEKGLRYCLISKATDQFEDQQAIMSAITVS